MNRMLIHEHATNGKYSLAHPAFESRTPAADCRPLPYKLQYRKFSPALTIRMSLKKNVLANYLGQGWTALMGIAFVPLYIKYLGMEAYGLIGVFGILQGWLTLLDMGMTPTLNREMARFTAGAHTAQSIRDLLRSLELICFSTAALIVLAIWLSATWFSIHWLQAEKLSSAEVSHAISIIGFVVALRFVESLYRGALLGLQRQVWLSVASSTLATVRGAGGVAVLAWVSPSIDVFFVWQGLMSLLAVFVLMYATYRQMPKSSRRSRFSPTQLKEIGGFASGMMATTLLSLLLMQADKIILSRMLSLEMFGYYTLAGTLASVLSMLTGPISQAYYPRFTQLVTQENTAELIRNYHQGAQLMSVLVVPAAFMLIFFGADIVLLWTGRPELAQNVAPLLALLAAGTMLNSLMHVPYILTLAYGWPGFGIRQNIVAVVLLVPAILWATPIYGAIGAAWIWVILNAGYVLIAIHFIHGRLLPDQKWQWYFHDVMPPIGGALAVAAIFGYLQPGSLSKAGEWIWLFAAGSVMTAVALLLAPILRKQFIESVR